MSGRVLQRHVKQCRSEEEYDTGKDFRVDRICLQGLHHIIRNIPVTKTSTYDAFNAHLDHGANETAVLAE